LDQVVLTFYLFSKDELLGSQSIPLSSVELEKTIDSKLEFLIDDKETGKFIAHTMVLSRLIKSQEVLFFNFLDPFEKLGYVRDQYGSISN
jgi:hypothetical protein